MGSRFWVCSGIGSFFLPFWSRSGVSSRHFCTNICTVQRGVSSGNIRMVGRFHSGSHSNSVLPSTETQRNRLIPLLHHGFIRRKCMISRTRRRIVVDQGSSPGLKHSKRRSSKTAEEIISNLQQPRAESVPKPGLPVSRECVACYVLKWVKFVVGESDS
jgi:hypothetical protein